MVKSCLVAICKNTQGVPGITFHKIGKKRYANRLKAIGRSADENLSPQNVICSKHFSVDDFIFFNGKKYLRLEALPRLFLPRRPSIEKRVETINEPPDKTNSNADTNTNNSPPSINTVDPELENDTWLMYSDSDILALTSQYDDLDLDLNEANLSMYPTNEFLSSLISDCCDNDDFDLDLDSTSTDLFKT